MPAPINFFEALAFYEPEENRRVAALRN